MKLSFSIPSKPPSNLKKPSQNIIAGDSKVEASTAKEYVTEFDTSNNPAEDGSVSNIVIPRLENTSNLHKRMKNLDLPPLRSSDDQPLQFEVHTGSSVEPSSDSLSYGLNVRQSIPKSADDVNTDKSQNPNPNAGHMLPKPKEDLKCLPDDDGMDEFSDMPVESFAAALLKGYGWYEGKGIGLNTKEDVKVKEYKRWSAREGFGFSAALPQTGREKRDAKNENLKEGREEKEGKGSYVGKHMRIIAGREMGMKGKVVKLKRDGSMVMRLSSDNREVIVQARDVAEVGSAEEERCMRKSKELKIKENNNGSSSLRSHRECRTKDMRNERKRTRDESSEKRAQHFSWLTSHIRVRIISKDLKGGKLYLKKGEVVDVAGPSTCDVSMDETRELIQGVNQDQLETAVPKRGGHVLVLYGRHKGVYGSLVERDTEKETGVVQNADTHELLTLRFDQIAEYIGDPSYIGY